MVGTWEPVGMEEVEQPGLRQRAGKRCQVHQCGQDTDITEAGLQPGVGSVGP